MKKNLVSKENKGGIMNKITRKVSMIILFFMMLPTNVYAAPTINPNLTQQDGIGAILSIIFSVSTAIGSVSLVVGIFMTIQSFMSDNPEKRNQGVTLAIVGAILLGLETLLSAAGILS